MKEKMATLFDKLKINQIESKIDIGKTKKFVQYSTKNSNKFFLYLLNLSVYFGQFLFRIILWTFIKYLL
jgi:hypothetical protein